MGRNKKTALPHNTDLHVASLCCWGKAVFLFCQKAHSFSIFREKSAFTFDFSETGNLLCPNRAKIFSFLAVQNPAPERGAIMRKQIQKEAASLQQGYAAMQGKAVAASIGGGNSFSVVGVSGLGKSTALQRVLSLFPQIIHHERYNGQMLCCQQIPYLVVQTPHDGSVKAMILDIYLQLDALLGTSYQHYALAHKLTLDVLVSQLNQIVRINHVGLLVIDELQNIAYRKNGIRFINFLVQLINGAGVSICMVGTPRVLHVLQQEFRSARRTTGLIYDRLPDDKEFALLLHGLWHYQSTAKKVPICRSFHPRSHRSARW